VLILALVLTPTFAGLAALAVRADPLRRALLLLTAVAHTGMTAACWVVRPSPVFNGWLALDALGLLFLSMISALFLAATIYGLGYLSREKQASEQDFEEGFLFTNAPEAIFTGCLLLFLAAMTLVTISQHFGLLWVAVEGTTLASAPLIYFHRHHRSLEATWKYLLICSVGIALALLGNFFLAVSMSGPSHESTPLLLGALVRDAPQSRVPLLKAAFLFLLVGYGTKMGLAPLHTWLPDAHSEAPSMISALLSGALLNCAFLAILRTLQVCAAAAQAAFCQQLFVWFGLVSMAVAAVFILGQSDYKRMLAYSSVEHMGILVLGIGLGGAAAFGAMLHTVNHSLTKAALFLVAGNILAAYKTKSAGKVSGVFRVLPASGVLWIAGFFAVTGSPPFGPFLSEFTILKAALDQRHGVIAVAYLVLLALIFIGMAGVFLRMAEGTPSSEMKTSTSSEPVLAVVPPGLLAAAVLILGVYIPPFLSTALHDAAKTLGGF